MLRAHHSLTSAARRSSAPLLRASSSDASKGRPRDDGKEAKGICDEQHEGAAGMSLRGAAGPASIEKGRHRPTDGGENGTIDPVSRSTLYPGHRPLTGAQTAMLTVAAGLGALVFPQRADLVGVLGETTGTVALRRMRDRMRADGTGADILARRPRVTNRTLDRAWRCQAGTLGAEYAAFMGTRRFDPADRPPVRFVPDEELAYVATRGREVHDIWHVLFDCPTTVQGELALKAVEFVQTGMPMTALSAAFAPLRLPPRERRFLIETLYPWAWRAGTRAADLMCLDYEGELETDLEELRLKWRITTAPREDRRA